MSKLTEDEFSEMLENNPDHLQALYEAFKETVNEEQESQDSLR